MVQTSMAEPYASMFPHAGELFFRAARLALDCFVASLVAMTAFEIGSQSPDEAVPALPEIPKVV
jgi:hypothetical protein